MQRKRDRGEMVEDFVAAVKYLQGHPDTTGVVGAVGFCFGGEMVQRLAVLLPDLAAAVAFYGPHPSAQDAKKIRAPILVQRAENDPRVNATWPEFEKAMQESEADLESHFYKGTGHGFHNDTTPRFVEDAAALAWQRTIEHFSEHLAAGV